ncbi:hypothetical protein C3381_04665 [Citrobacter freundii complex sp. CFNIH6]|nr:hypothetical protein C2U41_00960 [Citrobacter freundii complex sp. CFNIH4]PCQ43932.1 hypothetical protein CQA28_02630 [Citrobacter freundii]POU13997.1 hypothetical protein C3368_06810 [Citrobacter freundii complex sp. CFNIH7]POU17795.1 hypothetical protein C3381_04665 [Citrobacter freundii complex sp. CFNIH6]
MSRLKINCFRVVLGSLNCVPPCRYTILNDSANFLCCFFVNGLTLNENPVIVPYAVPGIYPTNYCLTGA